MKLITMNELNIVVGGSNCICYSKTSQQEFTFSAQVLCENKCCNDLRASVWSYGNSKVGLCRDFPKQKETDNPASIFRVAYYHTQGLGWQ